MDKDYHKNYYQENKERLDEQGRIYRQGHREQINARKRERYYRNIDEQRRYQREYMREYIKTHPQKSKSKPDAPKDIYKIGSGGTITMPKKYENKFDEYVDIVFTRSCILVYPHLEINNNNKKVIQKRINKCKNIYMGTKLFLKHWGEVPDKIKIEEYKKGIILIPQRRDEEDEEDRTGI